LSIIGEVLSFGRGNGQHIEKGKVYMISVWDAPDASNMILRLSPSKNNQEKGIRWAKDYEL
jgi:hypothetical protein